ncbi:MAG: cyanophycinase [Bacteroidota bacterium]|nr:cyanophycinase [Candidatus Kapabacteria bacterium]MDW8219286.1 cyanophycinase [Bacteroidota bacterium]
MINRFSVVLALLYWCWVHGLIATPSVSFAQASAKRGHLVIIGGGPRPEVIMKTIIDLAGGARSRIVILPMASAEMLETAQAQREQFMKYGAPTVDYIICDSASADTDSNLAKLRAATGVFFSGGDQNKLVAALRGTKLLQEIYALYQQRGGVIAGTSAGAAVQSYIMLTGDEAINKDTANPYGMVRKGNILTAEGFGFVRSLIIDQHFVKRRRQNRLLTLVLEYPNLLGVGIDESTCIVVKPNNTFEVLGEATVQVFDARGAKNIRTDAQGNLAANDIRVHILPSGATYTMPSDSTLHKRK